MSFLSPSPLNHSIYTYQDIKDELIKLRNKEKEKTLSRYFKTGKGEYGEGDLFLGVTVPQQRNLVMKIDILSLQDISQLLYDEYHECRLTALLFLVHLYNKTKEPTAKETYFHFYLQHLSRINNWDLVDLSAPNIVGNHLLEKDKTLLFELAKTSHLWSQRIAIVATYAFIKQKNFLTTFKLSDILLSHSHDLIHKAVGRMLREVGKQDLNAEIAYLTTDKKYLQMSRTTLRYAIERFPENLRQQFLKSKI